MLDRRRFIETGIAGSLATAFGIGALPQARGAPLQLYAAVCDERFAQSLQFVRALAARGVPSRIIREDVTELWYAELYPRWCRAPAAIAGLTTYAPHFCLERLAWDHGMRVIYRGAHRQLPDGRFEHVLHGAAHQTLLCTGPRARTWAVELAAALAHLDSSSTDAAWRASARASGSRRLTYDSFAEPGVAGIPGVSDPRGSAQPLYSWVIAPIARS